jgi:hypothetical protein
MSSWPSLAAETVVRRPPVNLDPADTPLFAHELTKYFGPVAVLEGAWDSTADGMLLAPGSFRVEPRWFQAGQRPGGTTGLKVGVKGLLAWTKPRRPVSAGRVPLVVTDEFTNGYFHWVADTLPKLWWLRDRLHEVNLVLPWFATKYRYMAESLALWPQVQTTVVPQGTRARLDGASLVPALAPTGNYRPDLMAGLAADWRRFVGAAAPFRKVYVSRAKAPWRKVRNEDEVRAALGAQGFERVFFEDLAFADQVKLMAETQLLVSNHGAGLTNLLFMAPGARVVEVRLRGDAANNCYFSLASAVGVDYAYLLADPADQSPAGTDSHVADLVVDPVALTALVRTLSVHPSSSLPKVAP